MSDFTMQVKIDPGSASPTIKSLQDAVDSLEKAGKSAGTAMATGMREGSTAAAGAAQSAKEAANQDAQWNMMLAEGNKLKAAEADMLARINGPLDKRVSGQEALNSLLAKGAINASDYANQMDRLDAAVAKSSGPQFGPSASQAGASGGAGGDVDFGGAAGMVAGLASLAALKSVGTAIVGLRDDYIDAANSAQRLVDSTHNLNDVLRDQQDLSELMHGSMKDTINLSAMVKEGTQDMNLTAYQTESLTKGINELMLINHHTTADAATAMKTLTFAFAEGTVSQRNLMAEFKLMPSLSQEMQESFHMTQAELMGLAKSGALSSQQLAEAMMETTKRAEEFSKQAETTGSAWTHMTDKLALAIGPLTQSGGALDSIGSSLWNMANAVTGLGGTLDKLQGQKGFQMLMDAWKKGGQGVIDKAAIAPIEQIDLGDMTIGGKAGKLSLYDTLLAEINKRHAESIEGMKAENQLWIEGKINMIEYFEGYSKYAKMGDPNFGKTMPDALGPAAQIGIGAANNSDVNDALNALQKADNKEKERAIELLKQLQSPVEKYAAQLEELGTLYEHNKIPLAEYNQLTDDLVRKFVGVTNPAKDYAKAQTELAAVLKTSNLSVAEQAQAYDNLAKKTGQARDVSAGFHDGMVAINKEIGQGGAIAATKLLTDGFNSVNSALTDLITTGTTDWSKFVKEFEANGVNFALKSLESSAMSALQGGTGGVAQGVTTTEAMTAGGATAATAIEAAMVAGGVSAASSIAAAMGIGGAASSGAASIGGALSLGAPAAVSAVPSIPGVGESYHVPGSGGSGGAPTVIVQLQRDDRALQSTMKGRAGAAITAAHVRENPRAYQRLLGRR